MPSDTLLVPIGRTLGAFYPGDGSDDHVQQVRIGSEVVDLSDEDFALWLGAHEDGRAKEGSDLTQLRKAGLVVDIVPGTESAVRFARDHRLLATVLGLGNTKEYPEIFSLGLLYQPLVLLSGPMFDLWEWAHLSPDLWSACVEAADVSRRAGETDPDRSEPERILATVLESLHHILASGAACLDVRMEAVR